jgi:2-desacetyl-2-hydroxyethyl bacteriochlorophyllide A dehydrogenase
MKAAIYHGVRRIEIEEVARPAPGPGSLLVEMDCCGICGSDLHSWNGFWEQPAAAHGHEVSGVVAEVGDAVEGFRVGDRVCTEWFSHCGRCRFCRTGRYNLCESLQRTSGASHAGFAECVIAHQSSVFRLPDSLTFEEGALVEPLAVSCRAVRRCGEDGRGTVLVTGSGTIGLLAVAAARAFGAAAVFATARHDHQAAMSSRLGADRVLRPTRTAPEGETAEAVMTLTGGEGADAVIETTASAGGLADALASVRKGGVVVVVGGYHAPVEIDLKRVIDNEIRIMGSFCYGFSGMKRDFQWSIDLIASKKVQAQGLVTHRFPLDRIAAAFEAAADKGTRSIKVQIVAR